MQRHRGRPTAAHTCSTVTVWQDQNHKPQSATDRISSHTKLTCAGDLLVKKAREGVRVCMLVWDDKSSLNSNIMGGSGMMATHDEDTRKFFANTGVHIHHLPCLPYIMYTLEACQAKELVDAKGMHAMMAANAGMRSCSLHQRCTHCMWDSASSSSFACLFLIAC